MSFRALRLPSPILSALRHAGLVLAVAACPVTLSACAGGSNMTELETPSEGLELDYALVPGSIFDGSISSKRSDGTVGGNQSTRKLDLKTRLTVVGPRDDGAMQVDVVISEIAMSWVVPNAPMDLDSFVADAKQRLRGMKITFFLNERGEVLDFPDPPGDLPQEDQFLMELVLDGVEQAFYQVPEKAVAKGESWDDEKERGRKGKLGRYYKETTHTTFKGLFQPDATPPARVALLDVEAERVETITTKEGGHETKFVDEKTVTFDPDAGFLASMKGKRAKYDGDQVSRIEFRANWALTSEAAVAAPVTQKIVDPCDDDYVGGEDCTDPCSSNYMGDESCQPEGEAAEGEAAEGEAAEGEAAEGEAAEDEAAEGEAAGGETAEGETADAG